MNSFNPSTLNVWKPTVPTAMPTSDAGNNNQYHWADQCLRYRQTFMKSIATNIGNMIPAATCGEISKDNNGTAISAPPPTNPLFDIPAKTTTKIARR